MSCKISIRAFTLIELLIVVTIIIILAGIATVNLRMATERALKASDAANLHTVATALQTYYVDYGKLPPADREAGPFMSHARQFRTAGNGPAAGGSWDGVPWLLYEMKYVSDWKTLFCPKYLKLYRGGTTRRGTYPAYHNFRYAYNSTALSSQGIGPAAVMNGNVWIVRDLYLPQSKGFYPDSVPGFPDFTFPWGEGDLDGKMEHVMYSNMAVQLEEGLKDKTAAKG